MSQIWFYTRRPASCLPRAGVSIIYRSEAIWPVLYIVPTPIGNLNDISPRCARTLAEADFIAAEDTRVSLKLLNHLEIKKPCELP